MADAAAAVRIAPDPRREPWGELARQREAATLGMWLFLMSEMLFFGALFMAFSSRARSAPRPSWRARAIPKSPMAPRTPSFW